MRHLTILPVVLLLAACAATPSAPPQAGAAAPSDRQPDGHDHRSLTGMSTEQLVQHFGRPRLQVREGDSTKLQFATRNCVLDVYLYPGSGGALRATHVEARNGQGDTVSAQSCVYAIEDR